MQICLQCRGKGALLVPGVVSVDVTAPNEADNPVASGMGAVGCRQCGGSGITQACGG